MASANEPGQAQATNQHRPEQTHRAVPIAAPLSDRMGQPVHQSSEPASSAQAVSEGVQRPENQGLSVLNSTVSMRDMSGNQPVAMTQSVANSMGHAVINGPCNLAQNFHGPVSFHGLPHMTQMPQPPGPFSGSMHMQAPPPPGMQIPLPQNFGVSMPAHFVQAPQPYAHLGTIPVVNSLDGVLHPPFGQASPPVQQDSQQHRSSQIHVGPPTPPKTPSQDTAIRVPTVITCVPFQWVMVQQTKRIEYIDLYSFQRAVDRDNKLRLESEVVNRLGDFFFETQDSERYPDWMDAFEQRSITEGLGCDFGQLKDWGKHRYLVKLADQRTERFHDLRAARIAANIVERSGNSPSKKRRRRTSGVSTQSERSQVEDNIEPHNATQSTQQQAGFPLDPTLVSLDNQAQAPQFGLDSFEPPSQPPRYAQRRPPVECDGLSAAAGAQSNQQYIDNGIRPTASAHVDQQAFRCTDDDSSFFQQAHEEDDHLEPPPGYGPSPVPSPSGLADIDASTSSLFEEQDLLSPVVSEEQRSALSFQQHPWANEDQTDLSAKGRALENQLLEYLHFRAH